MRNPDSPQALAELPVFRGRSQRRLARYWFDALRRAADLPEAELPRGAATTDGPPPVSRWADRDPDAAARVEKAVLADLADRVPGASRRTAEVGDAIASRL